MLRIFVGLLHLFWSLGAAAEERATIAATQPLKPGTQYIMWNKTKELRVFERNENGRLVPEVKLEGKFNNPDWSLVWDDQTLLSPEGPSTSDFQIKLTLEGESTSLLLYAISPTGEIQPVEFSIHFPGYTAWRVERTRKAKSKLVLLPSLGLTQITYNETTVPEYRSLVLTGKFSFLKPLSPGRWDLGANVYMSLLPLNANQSDKALRFLGANLRLGYVLPFIRSPWRVMLMAGAYYTTTFAKNNSIGFKNMVGPQFFPTIAYRLKKGDVIGTYFKYSPITEFLKMSFKSRELAFGANWNWNLPNQHPMSIALDYAKIHCNFSNLLFIDSQSVSASVGYGF